MTGVAIASAVATTGRMDGWRMEMQNDEEVSTSYHACNAAEADSSKKRAGESGVSNAKPNAATFNVDCRQHLLGANECVRNTSDASPLHQRMMMRLQGLGQVEVVVHIVTQLMKQHGGDANHRGGDQRERFMNSISKGRKWCQAPVSHSKRPKTD